MTQYNLNCSYDLLIEKKCTKQILFVMEKSPKERLTKREIFHLGKREFGGDFADDPITVFRYLNTMDRFGILKKYIVGVGLSSQWEIANNPLLSDDLEIDCGIKNIFVEYKMSKDIGWDENECDFWKRKFVELYERVKTKIKVSELNKENGCCCDNPDCREQPHFSTNIKDTELHCSNCGANCVDCDVITIDEP